MKIYTLVKESYCYWNGDYDCTIELFKDKQSAMNYMKFKKEEILEDAYNELGDFFENSLLEKTEYNLAILAERHEDIYDFTNTADYFRISIEEWGYDECYILEKDIMEFKL